MRFKFSKTLLIIASLLAFNGTANAETSNTIIVFDASGSMWGQIDGKSKIEIAREAFANVENSWQSKDDKIGLIAYGHNRHGDCSDIELLIDPNGGSIGAVSQAISKLRPKGKTPLSDAVRMAAEKLRYEEDKATVILFSDGIETCSADPCALSLELEKHGIDFTAHVIGFGIAKDKDRAQLQCIADNSGGKYFDANNAGDLKAALDDVAHLDEPVVETEKANLQSSDLTLTIFVQEGSSRPDLVKIRATNLATQEKINLATLEGTGQMLTGVHAKLAFGDWKLEIISKEGTGSVNVSIVEERQKIALPFSAHGMRFEMTVDSPYQLGTEHAMFLNSLTNLQPNVTLIVAMFPAGSTNYDDRMDYEYRFGTDPIGLTLHGFVSPKTAGDYEIVVLNGTDLSEAIARFPITYVENVVPQWHGTLKGEVGSKLPVRISGNAYRNNRLNIEKDGKQIASYSVGRLKTLDGAFLPLPDVDGEYQLIYKYRDAANERQTISFGNLIVGEVILEDDADAVEPPADLAQNTNEVSAATGNEAEAVTDTNNNAGTDTDQTKTMSGIEILVATETESEFAYECLGTAPCQFHSEEDDISWTLLPGWKSSATSHLVMPGGEIHPRVTLRMQKTYDNGVFKVALNGSTEIGGEGACFYFKAGKLCRPDKVTDLQKAEFDMILFSLGGELPKAKPKPLQVSLGNKLPESGKWKVHLHNLSTKDCPASALELLAPPTDPSTTANFEFSEPFYPTQLKLDVSELEWKPRGPNKWRSTLADYNPHRKIEADGMAFQMVWDVSVFSKTHLLIGARITVKGDAIDSDDGCTVFYSGDYKYIWEK